MVVSSLFTYPLKSGRAIDLSSARISAAGIPYDRSILVINEAGKALTGRQIPELTAISASIIENSLSLSKDGQSNATRAALPTDEAEKISFKLFRNTVSGVLFDSAASDWISNVLGVSCRLVYVLTHLRSIDPKRGGKEGDVMGYADASPMHLITEESLLDLNSKLSTSVTNLHFRPNIVIQGGGAFDEDAWKSVVINDCEFNVHHLCKRCVFTTIDPLTSLKDPNIEPLTTLARWRRERNEDPTFGIYLVPRKTGTISVGDPVFPN